MGQDMVSSRGRTGMTPILFSVGDKGEPPFHWDR